MHCETMLRGLSYRLRLGAMFRMGLYKSEGQGELKVLLEFKVQVVKPKEGQIQSRTKLRFVRSLQ